LEENMDDEMKALEEGDRKAREAAKKKAEDTAKYGPQ